MMEAFAAHMSTIVGTLGSGWLIWMVLLLFVVAIIRGCMDWLKPGW